MKELEETANSLICGAACRCQNGAAKMPEACLSSQFLMFLPQASHKFSWWQNCSPPRALITHATPLHSSWFVPRRSPIEVRSSGADIE